MRNKPLPGLCKSHKNSYSSSRNKPLTGLVNSAKKSSTLAQTEVSFAIIICCGSKPPAMRLRKGKA
jgi:hypothetical protein